MLIKLTPDQVASYWDEIGVAIEVALPPIVGDRVERMNNILSAILVGGMDCWVSYRKSEEGTELTAIVTTTIVVDNLSGTRSLLVYSIYSPREGSLGEDGWLEGYEALSKYAKSVNCENLSAYSDNPTVLGVVSKLGGEANFRYIKVPLK